MEGGYKLGKLTLGGEVVKRRDDFMLDGQDKPRNLADYNEPGSGHFEIVRFYSDMRSVFPCMWIVIQKMGSVVSTEAGAERLFNTAGYTLRPERSMIKTETYERLVLAHCNLAVLFVPVHAVVANYLARDKNKSWSL